MRHRVAPYGENMPKIIYKQQHNGENGRRYSASRNSHFVQYIGEREHVMTTHETNLVKYIGEREHAAGASDCHNGLFGFINGAFSDHYDTKEMQRYVRRMSAPTRNVFHSIFSFTPDSAAEAGLNSIGYWEKWVQYHMSEVAGCMGMSFSSIEYLAAVHLKENQPHVHIMWWDKSQQVFINKVDPIICDKIRIAVIKSTYQEQFTELHNKEDTLLNELRQTISSTTGEILTNQQLDDFSKSVGLALDRIHSILPKKGQLVYKLMPSEVKQELNKLTHFIIDNNAEFRRLYDELCDCRRLYNEMLHSPDSSYGRLQMSAYMGKLNDSVETRIGNAILKVILREMKAGYWDTSEQNGRHYYSHRNNARSSQEWRQRCTLELFISVGRVLSHGVENNQDILSQTSESIFGRGDLSKEQLRELLLKKQDKENTAEM